MLMPLGDKEELFFQSIKEDRGSYFVEYRPPISGWQFATLQLVFPEEIKGKEQIAEQKIVNLFPTASRKNGRLSPAGRCVLVFIIDSLGVLGVLGGSMFCFCYSC